MRPVAALLLALALALAVGCSAPPPDNPEGAEDDFSRTDTAEDAVLPYKGAWLDAPRALSGVGQFDRLKGTIHDDARCSTMVAIAAAIVGGPDRFGRVLSEGARLRAADRDDLRMVDRAREAADERRLTPRHLHELSDVVVRAYKVANGAYDGEISRMVRASGYTSIPVGSKRADMLVASLEPGEVVPLATVAENIPHITLLWRDAAGTVRLYDSDDVKGSHVMPRGSARYRERVEDPQSEWSLAAKYR